jgi:pimeloyl-ACP methyl ester carboxylesterase
MEQIIPTNGVELWCETFGFEERPEADAVLLITGSGNSGTMWDPTFFEPFLDAGLRVIRYDARDTGQSTTFDFVTHPYTLADMAADAVGLLDALGVARAHIVGASMGGMVAQEIAIGFPERVLTLTTIMSTPAISDPNDPLGWTSGLPPMQEKVTALYATIDGPLDTIEARLDFTIKLFRALAGSANEFDEEGTRALFRREFSRFTNLDSGANHHQAIGRSRDRTELLATVKAPTLVIHGVEDPIIPVEHGKAVAAAVPGARFLAIDGMGHDLPPARADQVVRAIVDHVTA